MPSIPLPHAVPGAVVTRFPPEPSWHLDIGHCKAALMNQFVAAQFQGRWILRFDDTNPNTCSGPCVDTYLRDMPLLGLQPDAVSHASDYFGAMIADATALIESGLLYADDTPVELMRQQRLAKQASAARDRPTAASLAAWAEMQRGSAAGQAFCLRFRLQPGSENGALRDPVAYRVILTPHYKTGHTFKVYPTYDFACPWLDAAEGVTHALRTLEFRDRDCLYELVQKAVVALHPGWRLTNIWEFPRIHMAHTPQAKVHQRALLSAGLVDGPADPRLPTLAGLMRGGCHPEALRAFLLEQVTPARKETYHSWDKLWTLNRRLLDPRSARHMAVEHAGRALLTIRGGPDEPQCAEVAWKQGHVVEVVRYKQVWLDQADAELLSAGDEITLLAWGNATIISVTRAAPPSLEAAAADVTSADSNAAVDGTVGISISTQALTKQQQQQDELPAAHATMKSSAAAGSWPSQSTPLCDAAAAAAAAAPAGDTDSFKDVLALRDQRVLMSEDNAVGCSSCASTAGSTAVPQSVATSIAPEEGSEEGEVRDSEQRQQQQQKEVEDLSELLSHGANLGTAAAAAAEASQPAAAAAEGVVTHLTAVLHPAGDPKSSKLKVHWLPALPQLLPLRLVSFSHPVLVHRVVEEVDVVADFNHNSRRECLAWGDPSLLLSARKGAVVQLQRKGLFVVDELQLKPGTAAAAAAAAAAVAAAGAGAGAGAAANAGAVPGSTAADDASSTPDESAYMLDDVAVVPTGAEDLKAAAAAAAQDVPVHKVSLTPGLQISDVQQLVLFAIPDGHTKHEMM